MYKIIGADGQPYGPVSVEQLRRWIAENRLNAQSLIQPDGAAEWKPLSAFPEFADALASKPPPGTLPPIVAPPVANADALAVDILARDYQVDIGSCFSRAWALVMRHFWLVVGATFVMQLIQGSVGLLTGVCMGGLFWLMLKLIRGERADFGDTFAGFSRCFLPLFLGGLVINILISLGIFLCLLPGIYLAVAWLFALPLIIDKQIDFWPAMELSRKVASRHWWTLLALVLLGAVVNILGVLVCFVGVFITQAVVFAAIVYAYEDIFGRKA